MVLRGACSESRGRLASGYNSRCSTSEQDVAWRRLVADGLRVSVFMWFTIFLEPLQQPLDWGEALLVGIRGGRGLDPGAGLLQTSRQIALIAPIQMGEAQIETLVDRVGRIAQAE